MCCLCVCFPCFIVFYIYIWSYMYVHILILKFIFIYIYIFVCVFIYLFNPTMWFSTSVCVLIGMPSQFGCMQPVLDLVMLAWCLLGCLPNVGNSWSETWRHRCCRSTWLLRVLTEAKLLNSTSQCGNKNWIVEWRMKFPLPNLEVHDSVAWHNVRFKGSCMGPSKKI